MVKNPGKSLAFKVNNAWRRISYGGLMHSLLSCTILSLAVGFAAHAGQSDLPYLDPDFPCTAAADADRYIGDFAIDIQSFGGLELCNSNVDSKKLFNDLALVEKADFEPVSQGNVFQRGLVDRRDYYGFLKQRTYGINRQNDSPADTAYNAGGYFTMQDGWSHLSTLGRIGTVIHEARHTEGYGHVPCQFGPYSNLLEDGCDISLQQGGSHAVEMEYYARVVLESKNLHPVYKSMARLMLLGRSNWVFNTIPIRNREGLVGRTGAGVFVSDSGKITERELPGFDAGAKLKKTSFGASLVKGLKAVAVDLYQSVTGSTGLVDFYSYFKLFELPSTPRNIVDAEEFDTGTRQYFVMIDSTGRMLYWHFQRGQLLSGPQTNRGVSLVSMTPSGQKGVFVVGADGSLTPYDLPNNQLLLPLTERWDNALVSVARLGDKIVSLDKNGAVHDGDLRAPVVSAGLPNKPIFDFVNVPLYDAFQVDP